MVASREPPVVVTETTYVQIADVDSESSEVIAFVLPSGWDTVGNVDHVPLGSAEPRGFNAWTHASRTRDEARQILFASHASQNRGIIDAGIRPSGGKDEVDLADLAMTNPASEGLDLLAADVAAHWGQ